MSIAKNLLNLIKNRGCFLCLPFCYDDQRIEIILLRVTWWQSDGDKARHSMANFSDTDAIWFMKPITATKDGLSSFGYQEGICQISEKIGQLMVNIPCNIPIDSEYLLTENIKRKSGLELIQGSFLLYLTF